MSLSNRSTAILVGGPSGIGKTSIITSIVKLWPNRYTQPLTYTTRPQRETERCDRYNHITQEEMFSLASNGKLISLDQAYGNLYGICKNSVNTIINEGRIPIKDIHPTNQHKFIAAYPDTLTILLLAGEPLPWIDNAETSCRSVRVAYDRHLFPTLSRDRFSITKHLLKNNTVASLAINLETEIRRIIANRSHLKTEAARSACQQHCTSETAAIAYI